MNIKQIHNWLNGQEVKPSAGRWLDKYNPHTGAILAQLADSSEVDVQNAIAFAQSAFGAWFNITPVTRGQILTNLASEMKSCQDELANCIAIETGKPPQDAKAEVAASILQAEYWAGEGMRLYGRSLTSGMQGKFSHTVRMPLGVAGLIVPANTPMANIAWKVFPALICGNTVVMKASEDSPLIAVLFAQLTKKSGLPDGVFNVIQGLGQTAGQALVQDSRVAVISFTGSTEVGRWIAEVAGRRLARVSLELGGKNPFVVCDDANLEQAVYWATLSAFSNAGQRCAAGSRVIIFKNIYDEFKHKLIENAKSLKLGTDAGCSIGPVINKRQHQNILAYINRAKAEGGVILCGGSVPVTPELANGYYIQPTIIEGLDPSAEMSSKEVFGPVVTLYSVNDIQEALGIANDNEYGLTAAIHTQSIDRAFWFAHNVKAGVANINLGTFGSEPHMPFGGFGSSGNGTREPGVEALDVYTELKNISLLTRSQLI